MGIFSCIREEVLLVEFRLGVVSIERGRWRW